MYYFFKALHECCWFLFGFDSGGGPAVNRSQDVLYMILNGKAAVVVY